MEPIFLKFCEELKKKLIQMIYCIIQMIIIIYYKSNDLLYQHEKNVILLI